MFCKICRLQRRVEEMKQKSGKLVINGVEYEASKADLERVGELGCGTCAVVYKGRFIPTGNLMAVKVSFLLSFAKVYCKLVLLCFGTTLFSVFRNLLWRKVCQNQNLQGHVRLL